MPFQTALSKVGDGQAVDIGPHILASAFDQYLADRAVATTEIEHEAGWSMLLDEMHGAAIRAIP
jgi:hypothetical protein